MRPSLLLLSLLLTSSMGAVDNHEAVDNDSFFAEVFRALPNIGLGVVVVLVGTIACMSLYCMVKICCIHFHTWWWRRGEARREETMEAKRADMEAAAEDKEESIYEMLDMGNGQY